MAKLLIHGNIGGTYYDDVSSNDVIRQLDELNGETVHVHINSKGGDVFHGVAIYQALKDYKGAVIVHVDALAASAASIVAMAGKEIIMGDASMMMVHSPWSITIGNSDDHRKSASTLDSIGEAMLNAYRYQTGKSKDELRKLVENETWMDAEEAVKNGFATSVDGETDEEDIAALAHFDLSGFQNVPERLRSRIAAAVQSCRTAAPVMAMATTQGNAMNKNKKTPETDPTATATDQVASAAAVDIDQVRADERAAAHARISGIRDACTKAGLGDAVAFDLIQEGVSIDAARARIIDMLAEDTPQAHANINPLTASSNISIITGPHENFRAGAIQAILARAGVEQHDPQNAYASYTLMDMCRAAAIHAGISDRGKSRSALIGEVFAASHTTSDFAWILSNAMRKGMLVGYTENEETFPAWTRKGSLSDFKITNRVGLGVFSELSEIPDGGQFEQGTISDTGEQIQLATYGKNLKLSRKTIMNDDLTIFNRVPKLMGRAAARTIGSLCYAQITSNPKMRDGTRLFHSNHANDATNAALSMATLDAGRTAMGLHSDPDKKAVSLNIRPAFLLVPLALQGTAQALMASDKDPGDTTKHNIVSNMAHVIADGRLDFANNKQWYLAADPEMNDTMEVAYLDGRDTPELEEQRLWNSDGMEYRIWIDAAVKPLDYRGFYRGTGV